MNVMDSKDVLGALFQASIYASKGAQKGKTKALEVLASLERAVDIVLDDLRASGGSLERGLEDAGDDPFGDPQPDIEIPEPPVEEANMGWPPTSTGSKERSSSMTEAVRTYQEEHNKALRPYDLHDTIDTQGRIHEGEASKAIRNAEHKIEQLVEGGYISTIMGANIISHIWRARRDHVSTPAVKQDRVEVKDYPGREAERCPTCFGPKDQVEQAVEITPTGNMDVEAMRHGLAKALGMDPADISVTELGGFASAKERG